MSVKHKAANNSPDNLALLCPTHYWMYDAGLFPIGAIRLVRAQRMGATAVPQLHRIDHLLDNIPLAVASDPVPSGEHFPDEALKWLGLVIV